MKLPSPSTGRSMNDPSARGKGYNPVARAVSPGLVDIVAVSKSSPADDPRSEVIRKHKTQAILLRCGLRRDGYSV